MIEREGMGWLELWLQGCKKGKSGYVLGGALFARLQEGRVRVWVGWSSGCKVARRQSEGMCWAELCLQGCKKGE
jgi:hypothetical protein